MRILTTSAALSAALLLSLAGASPSFAKAHNNGMANTNRDTPHISGREGSANSYIQGELAELGIVANTGTAISGMVSGGQHGQAQSQSHSGKDN
jgi:hypothetical protein